MLCFALQRKPWPGMVSPTKWMIPQDLLVGAMPERMRSVLLSGSPSILTPLIRRPTRPLLETVTPWGRSGLRYSSWSYFIRVFECVDYFADMNNLFIYRLASCPKSFVTWPMVPSHGQRWKASTPSLKARRQAKRKLWKSRLSICLCHLPFHWRQSQTFLHLHS